MPVIVCDIGGGNAALDVLACGPAVITGNKCSATEVISAHECGFVRDARDGDGLGAPMTDLSDAHGLRGLSDRAGIAANAFDFEPMTNRLLDLHEQLLATPAG